ncbi:MAG: diaminopimelate epimerase [Lachnospiraceae bacterium]|nr:diaminopimelate epimerase [Lachnospiraceae bacterium]
MRFTKMHGCGNDYVYINGFEEKIPADKKRDFVIHASDRHFGIGSDGVIFINPSDMADFEMEMYNADGSRAEMCGNGIRCVAKYVFDKGMTDKTEITIESFQRIRPVTIIPKAGKAELIRVDMGVPELKPENIPVKSRKDIVVNEAINVLGKEYRMTCVSMGNPHAVVFMDPKELEIEKIGPFFENHAIFPNRTNTEFVRVEDKNNVYMRVWERGTGETLACGTGCCATAVACVLNGKTDRRVTVHVLGGDIEVEWNEEDGHIYMTGPGTTVFEGEIDLYQ